MRPHESTEAEISTWITLLGLLPCIIFVIAAIPELLRVHRRDEKESPSLSGRSTFFTKIALATLLLGIHCATLPEEWAHGAVTFAVSATQAGTHVFALYHQIHIRGHLQTYSHALLTFYALLTLSDIQPLFQLAHATPFKYFSTIAKVVLPFLVFCIECLGPQGWKPHLQEMGYENLPTEEGEED